MLVLIQNNSVPDDIRVWNECQSLRRAGCEVSVVCPHGGRTHGHGPPFEMIDGVAIHRYSIPRASGTVLSYLREYAAAFWRTRRMALRLARDGNFDVVHAANPPDFLLRAVRPLKQRGACFVFDHHDLWPELFETRFARRGGWIRRLIGEFERRNFRLADLVLAANESHKRVAMSRGGKRPDEVFVVRNGPVLADFVPAPADPALKRGLPHLISYAGVMAPQDGVDHALYALARLREKRDDWHAVLAGNGDSVDELRSLTGELGLEDRVEFSGWLDQQEIRRLLCTSDVCLVPDPKTPLTDASTLIKIAEYMAMSRAIVAYDLAESRVTAGDAALYAEPNNPGDFARAISELLDDPGRRARMGEVGRARVENGLSWEHSEQALIVAYRAALKAR